MNLFEKITYALDKTMNTPNNYGWFHLMWISIILITTILLCLYFKDAKKETFNKIILVGWIFIVTLEIYKQINFAFNLDNGIVSWEYSWYAFPFQFCSTPLYLLPFIIFLNDGKLKDSFLAYMATFSFFGGLVVFIYPNDVFISTIGINIQTMIHHGLQIVFGVFIVVYNRNRFNFKFYLKAIPLFAIMISIALILNIIIYHAFTNLNIDDTFNMFYISPYFECTLPILSSVYKVMPYSIFLFIYILGFVLISFIIYYIEYQILKLLTKRNIKNHATY